MKALILAAGDGTRINLVQPKVLIPVLGVPLIQRTISVLK
ncbi:MAG: NTP transferase domain-containing protein, partial [Candidatus Bathyarchaeia archaeon]